MSCQPTIVPPVNPCQCLPNVICYTPRDDAVNVCGVEYDSVTQAYMETGILPHNLRAMANSPAYNVYWV